MKSMTFDVLDHLPHQRYNKNSLRKKEKLL